MKKIPILLILVNILLVSPSFAFENGDLQFWNTESIEKKVNDKLKIKVEEELRMDGDMSVLYYEHTDLGVTYNVTKGLDLGLDYRQIYEKKAGRWKEENRPYGEVTLKEAWQNIEIADRNRLELRCGEGSSPKWRYRNKFSVFSPWKLTKFHIKPYAADEVFVDFYGDQLTRNRLYLGLKAKWLKQLKTDVFYLWELNKNKKKWPYNNVIGLKIKVVF